jgi:hypothetical protein
LLLKLLIKPIKYRLILGQLKFNQAVGLKILASVILYIGRRVAGPKSQALVCHKKQMKVIEIFIVFINRLCHMNGNFHCILMQILKQLFIIRK